MHPDAAQDKDLILSTLAPVFQLMESRLEAQEKRIGELEQVVYKFIMGAYDATKAHKKSSLMDMISGDFGEAIGPYKEIYSDLQGRDIVEDIVGMLDEQGIEGDGVGQFVQAFIDQAANKFGKYLPKSGGVEVEISAGDVPEEVKEEISEPEPEDATEAMMKRIMSVRKSGK